MSDYYIVNLTHTDRRHRCITIWRADNRGYCWALEWAGKYSHDLVMDNLHYYNTGTANIAVPCEVVESMAVAPDPGEIDNNAGPVVRNNRTNWKRLIANAIVKPPYKSEPLFPRARRREWEMA